ncbi:nucleotidyl transferase AbiEii/AbiGii toxin family protein [Geodermatophilus marinus]|uniref:nucleotidyl transferase AbiEii/AbiGii toxin family protein n=1 Tax=Geodermatophilus sp. LHW52908 TaxID=2303986 RepID=UPI0018F52BB8|nr:nucleotidyl transferase AbiEii/AbiGii toxin family protein [Geodermatophilus sp. LHW52908]
MARREKRPTDELQALYALEGFLARLSASAHADRLVLKGGVLLAAFDARRPTRDVDLQAQALPNDTATLLHLVRDIAATSPPDGDDGLVFDAQHASAEVIRDEDEYPGVRVSLTARLSQARVAFHVDVNVGDPIWPAPQPVEVPRLLGGSIRLGGYPVPMVHAEKIVTAISRGAANTRWRDFGDVYVLSGRHPVTATELRAAMRRLPVTAAWSCNRSSSSSTATRCSLSPAGRPGGASTAGMSCRPRSATSSLRSSTSPIRSCPAASTMARGNPTSAPGGERPLLPRTGRVAPREECLSEGTRAWTMSCRRARWQPLRGSAGATPGNVTTVVRAHGADGWHSRITDSITRITGR